jgi:formate C-acetyltransferase
MYKFRTVTDRIQHMHQLVRDRVIQTDAEKALITTEAYKKNEHVIPMIRRPRINYEVCSKMTVRVEDFEVIVGNKAKNFLGSCVSPEWDGGGFIPMVVGSGAWTLRDDGLYHNPDSDEMRLCVAPEDAEALKSVAEYWRGRTITTTADSWQPLGYDELCKLNVTANLPGMPLMMLSAGHLTPGFPKILKRGYASIRKEAQDWLESHINDLMGDDANKAMFYTGVTITCDAATTLIKRYGEECFRKAALAADPARAAELKRMGESLLWISENPARTFWEACQATIMYQLFMSLESSIPASAFGRFDQYTWPYLKKDLEAGTITMDQAQEISDAFFLKANCFYGGAPSGGMAMITGIGNTYQHTTIGGVLPETGEDATNPVTYMVLESIGRLGLHDPTISLRVNNNTPNELWECALETSKLVGGLPLFQNDEVIIPAVQRELGFELKDARDYALIGCQEITGSGNDYPACNGTSAPYGSVHYGVCLTIALNDGTNPFNNELCRVKTGFLYDMKTFDEVKAAYKKVALYLTKAQVSINNYTEYLATYHSPLVALSISMEGCMESGKDVTWGGAKYNSFGGTATGLATVADSLTAIKYMVFDKKLVTAKQLYDAFMANWEGYEDLRQQVLHEVPHYGNGIAYADDMMKWVTDTYYEICEECFSVRCAKFKAGLYSASDHVYQGYHTWATPDGRKTGEALADGSSPAQGRDVNGPTAVFSSATAFDNSKFMDGIALNMRIHPTALRGEEGIAKLRDMTKTYFDNKGMEVQFNVVSAETMKAAQADPEAYRNLVVRIAGYSAYFVELNADCQNDIINRTENVFA